MEKLAAKILRLSIMRISAKPKGDSDDPKEESDSPLQGSGLPDFLEEMLPDFLKEMMNLPAQKEESDAIFCDPGIFTKEAASGPILVAGHSGAGKTEVAKAIAKKLSIPVEHLDRHPDWSKYTQGSDWSTLSRFDPSSDSHQRYNALRKELVERVLQNKDRRVIEGAQLLSSPSFAEQHPTVLVDPSQQAVLRRKLFRDREQALLHGKTFPFTGTSVAKSRKDLAKTILALHQPELEVFRKIPGIHRVSGQKDKRLPQLIEALR